MTDETARWNARYRDVARSSPDWAGGTSDGADPPRFGPPEILRHLAGDRSTATLPTDGAVVDLAGGHGGGALFLAARGLTPILIDISDVALSIASDRAAARGVELTTIQLDLDHADLAAALAAVDLVVPDAHVTLVSCFHYLNRGLLTSVARDLPPGATFLAAIATVANLERNPRPPARFLLEPGEMRSLVVGGDDATGGGDPGHRLEVLHDREGWNDLGHHEAVLIVRKPATGP